MLCNAIESKTILVDVQNPCLLPPQCDCVTVLLLCVYVYYCDCVAIPFRQLMFVYYYVQ